MLKVVLTAFLVLTSLGSYGLMVGKQPMSAGASLLGCSLGVAGCVGCVSSPWLGFLVVMVYAGGMMVIFSYVCCLASNCLFWRPNRFGFAAFMCLLFLEVCLGLNDWNGVSSESEVWSTLWLVEGGKAIASGIYGWSLVLLGLVIFVVMVAVVKLCNIGSGPLRPF